MMDKIDTKKLENYIKQSSQIVATRTLYYSEKESDDRLELVIDAYMPVELNSENTSGKNNGFRYASYVEFGAPYGGYLFYGYDAMQALMFATDVDAILIQDNSKYDFFLTRTDGRLCYFDYDYTEIPGSKIEAVKKITKKKLSSNDN